MVTAAARLRRRNASSAFDPLSLSPVAWFKAESLGLADGTRVSSWTDLSGNGRHATQAAGSQQPELKTGIIGGKAVVRFVSTRPDILKTAAFARNQQHSAFVVCLWRDVTNCVVDGLTSFTAFYKRASATTFELYAGTSLTTSASTPATKHVHYLKFAGASSLVRVDGTQVASGNAGSTNASGLAIGGAGGGTEYANVDVAEILLFNGVLSDANRNAVEAYLGSEYGITVA